MTSILIVLVVGGVLVVVAFAVGAGLAGARIPSLQLHGWRATTIAALTIAVVASVFAIWPVVADAPWEDDPVVAEDGTDGIRCEAALELRESSLRMYSETRIRTDRETFGNWIEYAESEIDHFC